MSWWTQIINDITEGVWDISTNPGLSCIQDFLCHFIKCSKYSEEGHETWYSWLSAEALMPCLSLQSEVYSMLLAWTDINNRYQMSHVVLHGSLLWEMGIHHCWDFLITLRVMFEFSWVIISSNILKWISLQMFEKFLGTVLMFVCLLLPTNSNIVYSSRMIVSLLNLPNHAWNGRTRSQCQQSLKQGPLRSWMRLGFSLSYVIMVLFSFSWTWFRVENCKCLLCHLGLVLLKLWLW